MKNLILLLCAFIISCSQDRTSDILTKSIDKLEKYNDQRKIDFFQLENGMKVYLVSMPGLKKSMVSLSVKAGSGLDPKGQEGIAHFLEHMLFLGTKKYPQVGEFQSFFSNHQGSFNAYTAIENTNYQFEIPHEHLKEALDRFSQFFISPLFTEEYVAREKNAVHSEHSKNLLNDNRRLYRIKQLMLPENHPVRLFSTGNLETLKNVSREDVINFYKKHYSSNIMNLVIYSDQNQNELRKYAHDYFNPIKNQNLVEPEFPLVKSKNKGLIVEVKSKTRMQKLSIDFNVPFQNKKYWKSKPLYILGHLIGHEGEGSLLSVLKKENLAFGLSAGGHESNYQALFSININLTEKGLNNIERIIGLISHYVELIKIKGSEQYIYDELNHMARIQYVFGEQDIELGEVTSIADSLFDFPFKDIEKRISLLYEKPTEEYAEFLNSLNMKNAIVYLQHDKAQSNKKEKYYGIEYKVTEIKESDFQKWQKYSSKDMKIPVKNEYIPANLNLKLDEKSKQPKIILNNDKGIFYFKQNETLLYPQSYFTLRLLTHKKFQNPKEQVLISIYLLALSETLNEWKYMVSLAGLNTSVESTARGIQIDVNGFSDKIELVAEDTLRKIKSIEINEERFKSYIQEISKSFENFKLQPEFRQASFWLSYLIKKNTFTNKQLLDELKRIKLQEVNSFIPKLYEKIKIEGLLYGNSNSSEIMPLLNKVHEILGAKILEDENLIIEEDIKYPPGTKIFEFPSNGNNNVWYGYYQLGARDIKLNAQMRVLGSIINSEFYSEMRTNQQLGYIVYSGYDYASKSYGFSFLIQSSTHKAKELEQRALKWIGLIDQLVANFPDEKFEKIKQIISNEILLPEKNMKEKMIWLTTEAFVLKGDFDYRKNFAKEILNLEKEKLLTDIKKLFIENPTLLSIFVGKNFKMPMKIQELKEKLPSYK